MPAAQTRPRFSEGQRITAIRSGSSVGVAVVLEVRATEPTEVYRVRWADGQETFFVPGPDACSEPSGS